ncbi:hypothetical protein DAI22_05g080400 [Oryza sativa Japonica Group]|nr:hypothetical protein DAI22_05g080400 [Oryza sativa Japonica Group]
MTNQPHAKPVADVDLSRVPESIRPQFESWYRRHYAHTRFVNAESSAPNSCKEPASLRAQIEEKKHELFHLLFELKYGRKSIAGGEKLSIQDERILGELTPYRELKAMADKYGLKQALKYIGITYVLGFAVLGMAVNHM